MKLHLAILGLASIIGGCSAASHGASGARLLPNGLGVPDGSRIAAGVDSFRMSRVRGRDATEIGWAVDRIERQEIDGRAVLVRTYSSEDSRYGTSSNVLIDDARTLAPVRHVNRFGDMGDSIVFLPGRIRGVYRPKPGTAIPRDKPVPDPIYGASSFDLVLRALPLENAGRGEVPVLTVFEHGAERFPAAVSGREMVGRRSCWRVEARYGTMPVTFWIDAQDRRLCKQVMWSGPNERVVMTRW